MSQTFSPTATYGSNDVKNRVRPGGSLGSNQYYYTTNASTGEITVNRLAREKVGRGSFRNVETSVGTIPQGGKFTPNSNASDAEKSHYSSSREIGKARSQALQVARREWDGKTQPPPTQAIYGTDSGNVAYTPAGSSTVNNSTRGAQNTGFSNVARSALNTALSGGSLGNFPGALIGGRGRGGGGVMVYPTTLRQSGNSQDYIKLTALKYAPKQMTQGGAGNLGGWEDRNADRKGEGTVILPIPGGISDANAVSWGGDQMNAVDTAMANLALTGIEKGFEEMGVKAAGIAQDIKTNKAGVKKKISTAIAGMASGTGAQVLTRTTGKVMNPNMELLFKEPSLRPFTFTWKLAARSRQEANTIIEIINFFKRNMAPTLEGGKLFLMSPNTWRLTYMHRGRPHKYLNKFKECAMNSLTTQYTPDGNYATFESGHMTSYSITMSLTELEPVFSNDYKGGNEIGY